MTIDVYTSKGTKEGTVTLPKAIFGAPINEGLMHQAVVRKQSNDRSSIAHAKSRGEVRGSTRKLFQQKGTGRARRGSVRSPVLRGGGKAFGPKSVANFVKDMPRKMRRAALFSALSLQAKNGVIIGLKDYPDTVKTKDAQAMLQHMPVDLGRNIVIVTPRSQGGIALSVRNIPGVRTVMAQYLNPVDVLGSRHIIVMVEALKELEKTFGNEKRKEENGKSTETAEKPATKKKATTSKK